MRRAYVIHGLIGESLRHMYTNRMTVDTGTGPNLIRYELVPKELRHRIEPCEDPGMIAASGNNLEFMGTVRIVVRILDFKARIHFAVVRVLPPGILLGTSFIDRFVRKIDPRTRLIELQRSRPAPILASVKINHKTKRLHSPKTPNSTIAAITEPEPLRPIEDEPDKDKDVPIK